MPSTCESSVPCQDAVLHWCTIVSAFGTQGVQLVLVLEQQDLPLLNALYLCFLLLPILQIDRRQILQLEFLSHVANSPTKASVLSDTGPTPRELYLVDKKSSANRKHEREGRVNMNEQRRDEVDCQVMQLMGARVALQASFMSSPVRLVPVIDNMDPV